jgi:hypothetical protein
MANLAYETGNFVFAEPNFAFSDGSKALSSCWDNEDDSKIAAIEWYQDAVQLCEGWNAGYYSLPPRLAIFDNGIKRDHEDLSESMGSSTDGCDTYRRVDDTYQIAGSGSHHGTKVAGVAGAVTGNYKGISGSAGYVRLVPIMVDWDFSPSVTSDIVYGLNWAMNHDIDVINISWNYAYSSVISAAIATASNSSNDIAIFCATGNHSTANYGIKFPATLNTVWAVNGFQGNLTKHEYSYYGTQLDIMGGPFNVRTTNYEYDGILNKYSDPQGTSYSAAYMSGIAAFIRGVNPTLSHDQVFRLIAETAQRNNGYNYTTGGGGFEDIPWNIECGYGIPNVEEAASRAMIDGNHDIYGQTTYTLSYPLILNNTWTTSSNLTIISSTKNSITVEGNATGQGWIKASYTPSLTTLNKVANREVEIKSATASTCVGVNWYVTKTYPSGNIPSGSTATFKLRTSGGGPYEITQIKVTINFVYGNKTIVSSSDGGVVSGSTITWDIGNVACSDFDNEKSFSVNFTKFDPQMPAMGGSISITEVIASGHTVSGNYYFYVD